jgi:hypothetical protein
VAHFSLFFLGKTGRSILSIKVMTEVSWTELIFQTLGVCASLFKPSNITICFNGPVIQMPSDLEETALQRPSHRLACHADPLEATFSGSLYVNE